VTRIPQLEQELVAAAARLQGPRRLLGPAARAALAAAALVAVAVLTIVGTADDDGDRRARPSGASSLPPDPDLVDHEAGVRFALDGRVLTVSVLPSAPSKTRTRLNGARIRATCGQAFTEGPGPGPGTDPRQARTRLWPAGSTLVRFRFLGDISRIARWCRLEDPVVGHVAFVKFRATGSTLSPEEKIERTGNEWARFFAASATRDCRYMTQPLCERISCERISGPMENCTPPSEAYRKSFRDATVQDIVIKGHRGAARFSNGEAIEFFLPRIQIRGGWLISKVGGNAGRALLR